MPGRNAILAACGVMVFGVLAGLAVDQATAAAIMSALKQQLSGVHFSFAGIFLNNLASTAAMALGGFLFAVPSALLGFMNFLAIGAAWQVVSASHPPLYFFALILPHGILEIPAIVFALSAAFTLAGGAFRQVFQKKVGHLHAAFVRFVKTYLLLVVPLLAAAALIETYVTPGIVRRVTGG